MNDRNKLIKNSMMFCLILLVISLFLFSIPFYIFYISKEGYMLEEVIKTQYTSEETVIFGPVYSNPDEYYKLHCAITQGAKILILGTSRVMEFRSDFFNTSFYNGGGGIEKVGHLKPFLERMPKDKLPEIIIIGLDQRFFNPNWYNGNDDGIAQRYISYSKPYVRFQNNILKIYSDLVKGKINISKIEGSQSGRIGIAAIEKNRGFLNDGSYYYGPFLENAELEKVTKEGVNSKGENEYANKISLVALADLNKFLLYCNERNIHVIAFLPPYATEYYKINKELDTNDVSINLNIALTNLFGHYNYSFFDFSDLRKIDSSDDEMLDLIHGTDKQYLRILLKMAEKDRVLEQHINIKEQEQRINTTNTHLGLRERIIKR